MGEVTGRIEGRDTRLNLMHFASFSGCQGLQNLHMGCDVWTSAKNV